MASTDKGRKRIRVWVNDRRVSQNLPAGTTAEQARDIECKIKLRQIDPLSVRTRIPTYEQHAQFWLSEVCSKEFGFSYNKKCAQVIRSHLEPAFGRLPVNEINPEHIVNLRARLLDRGLKPETIGNILSTASNIFKDAIIRFPKDVLHNPTAGMRRLKRAKDRQTTPEIVCWSLAERDHFLRVAKDADYRVFQVAMFTLFTGLSPMEVRGLLRDSIDWESGTVTVQRMWCTKQNKLVPYTKNRITRIVSIPKPILGYLADKERLAPHSQVFPEITNGYGFRNLRPLMQTAGVRVMTFHGSRHTYASHLYAAKKDLLLVKNMLGHRSIATTDKYVHLLNSSPSGATDCLLDGATFLGLHDATAKVVGLFQR